MTARSKFTQFHQREPRREGTFASSLVIPEVGYLVGKSKSVLYKSDKLNPSTGIDEGWIEYVHDHGPGVNTYRFDRGAKSAGIERAVPPGAVALAYYLTRKRRRS